MRKIIAALQTSVDGFIEGPNGELDWAMAEDEETWKDVFAMLKSVDTCILGRVMYRAGRVARDPRPEELGWTAGT